MSTVIRRVLSVPRRAASAAVDAVVIVASGGAPDPADEPDEGLSMREETLLEDGYLRRSA